MHHQSLCHAGSGSEKASYLEHFKSFGLKWYKVHSLGFLHCAWTQFSSILCFYRSTSVWHVAHIGRGFNLVWRHHPTFKCHPVSINWLFLQRDLKELLTGFQIEHTDTGSSAQAKLTLKLKMLRCPLKMCELISPSMVFFLSFVYDYMGSIIHYSWISLCGKNSISKQHNTKFTMEAYQNATWMLCCCPSRTHHLGFIFITAASIFHK